MYLGARGDVSPKSLVGTKNWTSKRVLGSIPPRETKNLISKRVPNSFLPKVLRVY
jgi:hypothetical protein